eukprot:scaffold456_cov368-Pavlova_lutheri.AAC.27
MLRPWDALHVISSRADAYLGQCMHGGTGGGPLRLAATSADVLVAFLSRHEADVLSSSGGETMPSTSLLLQNGGDGSSSVPLKHA